jgi:hypothetical protein
MPKTYTYTARSVDDPARAVTFTLHDHHLTAEFALPSEEIEQRLKVAARREEAASKQQAETDQWLAAVAEPLRERGNEPFVLDDVDASMAGEDLRVTAWSRTEDRRLQPIVIALEHVDNPQAAAAFANEVNRRKLASARRVRLTQAVGRRAIWYVMGFISAVALIVWLQKKSFDDLAPDLSKQLQLRWRAGRKQARQANRIGRQRVNEWLGFLRAG